MWRDYSRRKTWLLVKQRQIKTTIWSGLHHAHRSRRAQSEEFPGKTSLLYTAIGMRKLDRITVKNGREERDASEREKPIRKRTTSRIHTQGQGDSGEHSVSSQALQVSTVALVRWRHTHPDLLYSWTTSIQVQHQQSQEQNIAGSRRQHRQRYDDNEAEIEEKLAKSRPKTQIQSRKSKRSSSSRPV